MATWVLLLFMFVHGHQVAKMTVPFDSFKGCATTAKAVVATVGKRHDTDVYAICAPIRRPRLHRPVEGSTGVF